MFDSKQSRRWDGSKDPTSAPRQNPSRKQSSKRAAAREPERQPLPHFRLAPALVNASLNLERPRRTEMSLSINIYGKSGGKFQKYCQFFLRFPKALIHSVLRF